MIAHCPSGLDAMEHEIWHWNGRRFARVASQGGGPFPPAGMQGWSRVVFRRDDDGRRVTLSLEDLLGHLPAWGN